ncbi:LysR family transcriptional regulator [Sphingomonas sp. ASY06-1R]|uniref:LysR family transcriptional regulator n=1 Tax=Sphingomonas sp. ASY06-1R TaxID=3445771 RepID=UPI003FA334D3
MQLNRTDLADFSYFMVIARHRNFRRAGLELGISASALSHSLRGLETRLGVRLLNRTSRSVTLTAAGDELRTAIEAHFEAIGSAVDVLNRYRDDPAGRIRLNVLEHAATLLLAPALPSFIARYPHIEVDIVVNNGMVDVVQAGADAGIRYGGTVPEDMVAQRLSPDMRWVATSAPSYFDLYGTPDHPKDLMLHNCLRFRLGDDSRYAWEFDRGEESVAVDVPGALTIDNSTLALELARGAAAIAYAPEPLVLPFVERGELQIVLEDWASDGPGFHIYYPGRRQLPTALRLLIEHIRAADWR